MPQPTTFLTFASGGREAVETYVGIFPNSSIHHLFTMPGADDLLHASFSLDGAPFMAMDGGPSFAFSTGTSLFIPCADQSEVDHFWTRLTEGGGQPGRCGWLTDRFGMSWQVVPHALGELMSDPDPEASGRVRAAMLSMDKLDIEGLRAAHEGRA